MTSLDRCLDDGSSIEVAVASEGDAAAWTAYVDANSSATVFHQWAWRGILKRSFRHASHYLVARRQDRLVGILPLAQMRAWPFGNSLTSLPFCSWAGPLADDPDVVAALDQAALRLAQALEVDHLSYRSRAPSSRDWALDDLYVEFRKELAQDHEVNLKRIPRKQRASIRRGMNAELSSRVEGVESFYPLYLDNMHRHGTPGCPKRFFDEMQASFGEDCEVLVVRNSRGDAISAVLSLYFRDEVLPFYAGDLPEAREVSANDFKYWQLMRHAVDRGCRSFNFGRSKRESGSLSFKKNWGFEPTPLYYEYKLVKAAQVPGRNPSNPKFSLVIQIWRRLPRAIVDRAGPLLVRGLG